MVLPVTQTFPHPNSVPSERAVRPGAAAPGEGPPQPLSFAQQHL